ncbi:ATP-binding region, ATPase-like domain protein [Candidatus Magnetobacterium bavaricum]|uniref:ATP-binding region, ATPase-like domain protein n=1 Tax=Candidatus Magnetobacterium bavaricum TaxID=29290 RepID=A0A0F3GSZ4_9BACT|nr:ATP-binding region, ATPase-like domain protein [Candidatus Magnetobacterium bavaricum]
MEEAERKEQHNRLIRHKRMLHAQRILSMYLNASVCLLRGDGVEKIHNCWKDNGAPVEVLVSLKKLITSGLPDDPLDEKMDKQYWYWFYPLWDKSAFADREELEKAMHLEERIEYILWKSEPLTKNPFYVELKRYFPFVIVATRLRYLRLIYLINDKKEEYNKILENPIGLSEILRPIKDTNLDCGECQPDILIVGCARLEKNWNEFKKKPRGVLLEGRLNITVEKLLKTLDDKKKEFGYNQRSYLLNQFTMYPLTNESIIHSKAELTYSVCKKLCSIEGYYGDRLNDLHKAEWRKIVFWTLFLYKRQTKLFFHEILRNNEMSILIREKDAYKRRNVLKQLITNANLEEERLPVNIKIFIPLSERTDRNYILLTEWNCSVDSSLQAYGKFMICLKTKEPENMQQWPLWFEKNSDLITDDIENEMRDNFQVFMEEYHNNESHTGRVHFDSIRNTIHDIPFENIEERIDYVTKMALYLVAADKAIYYSYDSLNNILIPKVLIRDRDLQYLTSKQERKAKEEAFQLLTKAVIEWASIPENRLKSSVYSSIDTPCLYSRFKHEKSCSPLTCDLLYKVEDNVIDNDWFHGKEDIMALPIMFHGRKQGVLYLDTVHKCQFILQDRYRLLNLIQIFETELFKARLVQTLKDMNSKLSEAISKRINENDFCNDLAKLIASLLGAADITLWWIPKKHSTKIKLLGCVNSKIRNLLENRPEIYEINNPSFDNVKSGEIEYRRISDTNSDNILKVFSELKFKGIIKVPMKNSNVEGIMMIHDWQLDCIPTPIEEELYFLAQEVLQILMHYFEHMDQINFMRIVLGHDIDSSLFSIQGSCKNLYQFVDLIPYRKRGIFVKQIKDIEGSISLGHTLIEYFTTGEILRNVQYDIADPLLAYVYHLPLQEELKTPIDLKTVIESVLHSKKNKLYGERQVNYEFYSLHVEPLWLHEHIVRNVFNNLIDNIIKYGNQGSSFTIKPRHNPGDFEIIIANTGKPLLPPASANPELVFEKGMYFVDANTHKGRGLGLYIARKLARAWGGNLRLMYEGDQEIAQYTFIVSFPLWLFNNIISDRI